MSINRRQFIQAGIASTLGLGMNLKADSITKGMKAPNSKPNILLVVTDQERARHLLPDDLSLPAHDRLKKMGVTYDNAQVVTSLCSMSRGTIYTGQHQQFNGVWENTPIPVAGDLKHAIPTIGHMLTEQGYITGYFGKWHLNKLPHGEAVGFDKMSDLLASYGFQESDQDREIDGPLEGHQWDPYTIDRASEFIHRHNSSNKPWFASVNLVNPHDIMFFASGDDQRNSRWEKFPFPLADAPNTPHYKKQHNTPLLENFGLSNWENRPRAHKLFFDINTGALGKLDFSDIGSWQSFQDYYFNCLQDVDQQLQRLLQTMDETQSWDDTVVVYTSDHGELLGAHHLRDKGPVVYKDCNAVPMIVVHPKGEKNTVSKALTSHIDIAPTLLEISGLSQNEITVQYPGLKGKGFIASTLDSKLKGLRSSCLYQWSSLVYMDAQWSKNVAPLLANKNINNLIDLFSSDKSLPSFSNRCHFRGVFDGRYKFARYFSPTQHRQIYSFEQLITECDLELYDLESDPHEVNNLAVKTHEAKALIIHMNEKLETLIHEEVGEDLGNFLPGLNSFWSA